MRLRMSWLPIGEQDLPRALPWDDISTSFFDATPIPPSNLVALRARSAERIAISNSLAKCGNNISQAARDLGVSRMTLYRLMAKHAIAP